MRAGRSAEALAPRSRRRTIRAVTLDLWGTIFLDGPASDDRYMRRRVVGMQAALTAAGFPVDPHRLERAYATVGHWLGGVWQMNGDVPVREHVETLLKALDPALPPQVGPDTMAALVRAYESPVLLVPPAVDPGARAALEALAASGILLGVISNTMRTPGDVVRQVLDRAGLLTYFKVLTFSDECGIRKPARAIFQGTLALLDVPAHEAAHVGDDPVLDVEGPRDAGMLSIQVTPGGLATAPVKPHAVIRQLGELPAAVRRLR
jgi:putative hydrolase of the HAD superfamily